MLPVCRQTTIVKLANSFPKPWSRLEKDGVVTVEEAKGLQTELEIVEGMQFDPRIFVTLLRDQFRSDGMRV